ncbi:YbaK/EbsC family protein [Brevibacillus humidisoli]|uniref:YbaK/EbsC family protein n=1 Tax=Brevibacillus humidisoli TaxID=2895522 RepID=UPI001E407AFF|nr:YbaK/EbsC family protein [Brevibacillus humidisoli]UFJ41068.1 YbaK/EbsC family protein [Brevibacillus humidisoli]
MPINRVRDYVAAHDPSIVPIEFAEETKTVEDAARVLGVEPGQIAKSILFRAGEQYGLFVAAGDVKVSAKVVKALLGGKPRMAKPQEVEEVTGFRVGGVCPFALAQEVPIFLDESMKRFSTVYTAAGTANSVLPVSFAQLQEITGGTVVEMQQDQQVRVDT